jgi:hypothetical protein
MLVYEKKSINETEKTLKEKGKEEIKSDNKIQESVFETRERVL